MAFGLRGANPLPYRPIHDYISRGEAAGMTGNNERSLLLTGATGFVGGAVRPWLARE